MFVIVEPPVLWVYRSSHVSPFHVLKVGKTQIRCTDISSGLLAARQSGACDITWASAGINKFLHFMAEVLADDGTKTDIVALSSGYTRLEAGEEGRVKSKDERFAAGSASNASSSVQAGHHSHGQTGQNP